MSEQQLEEGRRQGNGGARSEQRTELDAPAEPAKKSRMRLRVGLGLAVVAVVAFLWWLHARKFEDTDDAQVDGYITAVSSRVPGTVVRVLVEDNQAVKKGDLLVELDTADLEVAVAQAGAAAAQAEAAGAGEEPPGSITATPDRASVKAAGDEVADTEADLEAGRRELGQALATNR